MPTSFSSIELGGEGSVKFLGQDCTVNLIVVAAGIEPQQPTTVWRNVAQPFFGFAVLSMDRINSMTEFSLRGVSATISEIAAMMTHVIGL